LTEYLPQKTGTVNELLCQITDLRNNAVRQLYQVYLLQGTLCLDWLDVVAKPDQFEVIMDVSIASTDNAEIFRFNVDNGNVNLKTHVHVQNHTMTPM